MMKRKTFGVPYRGSKNKLAQDIIDLLPEGRRLVDLFAGGCAITHCALLSGKWDKILNNDLCPLRGQTLFRKAVEGEYNKEEYYRIVGQEEFVQMRFKEPHLTAIWGFNSDWRYMGIGWYKKITGYGLTDIHNVPKGIFNPLPRLRRLQKLTGLDVASVEWKQMDYRDYQHEEGDVVYCDPPYDNTDNNYRVKFDHTAFWEWARTRDYPVYVSEYKAPDDFVSIWSKRRGGVQNPNGLSKNTIHIEHLYINSKWTR